MEIFTYTFMIRAFEAGIIIAVIAPLIGNFLVIKRFSLIADTLSHVALSGVALGIILGFEPTVVTLIVTLLASIAIERIRTSRGIPGESVLAIFLPGGLALSVVLISLGHGLNANIYSYLFGSITTVTDIDVWLTAGLGVVTIATVVLMRKKLLYCGVDEEAARASGLPVEFINTLLITLTAVTVSLSMRIVGVLLISALMVIPVISAMQIARSFRQVMAYSLVLAEIAVIAGIIISFYFNLPAGGVIVLLSLAIFGITAMIRPRI